MASSYMTCFACGGKIEEKDDLILSNYNEFLCKSCDENRPSVISLFSAAQISHSIPANRAMKSFVNRRQMFPNAQLNPYFMVPCAPLFLCNDCVGINHDMESMVEIEVKKLHDKLESLDKCCQARKYEFSSIIRKMQENMTKMKTIMKATGEVDNDLNLAFISNDQRLNINMRKKIKLDEIIKTFGIEGNVTNVLIQALKIRRVNIHHVIEYLSKLEEIINNELIVDKKINKLEPKVEEEDLVASQPKDETFSHSDVISALQNVSLNQTAPF
uniref:Uncharacterized protein n=1 Tax=Tetranychus urticae TaxID=32264 RepID=T1KW63_TETUR